MNRKIYITDPSLFDKKFYRNAYCDLKDYKGSLCHHYKTVGRAQNRVPSESAFRQVYPLFNLKVYKGLSRDLHFKHKEQYYSHLHHVGFDENRYFGYKNKTFINRGRMPNSYHRLIPFGSGECGTAHIGCPKPTCPINPCTIRPACPATIPAFINCGKSMHQKHHKHHKHHHSHHSHRNDRQARVQQLRKKLRLTRIAKKSAAELAKTEPSAPIVLTSPIGTIDNNPQPVSIARIQKGMDEASNAISLIQKERDGAVHVINDAENALMSLAETLVKEPMIASEIITNALLTNQTNPISTVPRQHRSQDTNTSAIKIKSAPIRVRNGLSRVDRNSQMLQEKKPNAHKTREFVNTSSRKTHILQNTELSSINIETASVHSDVLSPMSVVSGQASPKIPKSSNIVAVDTTRASNIATGENGGLALNVPLWNDINLLPSIKHTSGESAYKEFVKFNYADSGAVVMQQLVLQPNDGIEFTAEMPHNWKNNSAVIPHIHWAPVSDMQGTNETLCLTWMIKSVGSAFNDTDKKSSSLNNTFHSTIKIGPTGAKVHTRSDFEVGTPSGLTGNSHIVVGHLTRLTSGSSYTDDIFIIGLDLSVLFDQLVGDVNC